MILRARRDVGETLIEVLFTIVIVSLTFTSLFTSLATSGNAGNLQRISVQADVVMRNYAELTKAATQTCVTGGKYTVPTYPPGLLPTGFTTPTLMIAPAVAPVTGLVPCPNVATPQLLTLTVKGPLGPAVSMQIKVITP